MSKGIHIIRTTDNINKCTVCGLEKDTRPFAPGGKEICYECAMTPEWKSKVDEYYASLTAGKELVLEVPQSLN